MDDMDAQATEHDGMTAWTAPQEVAQEVIVRGCIKRMANQFEEVMDTYHRFQQNSVTQGTREAEEGTCEPLMVSCISADARSLCASQTTRELCEAVAGDPAIWTVLRKKCCKFTPRIQSYDLDQLYHDPLSFQGSGGGDSNREHEITDPPTEPLEPEGNDKDEIQELEGNEMQELEKLVEKAVRDRTLPQLLEDMWTETDKLAISYSTRGWFHWGRSGQTDVQKSIADRKFSVSKARAHCGETVHEIDEDVLEGCVREYAQSGKTARRSWFSTVQEDLVKDSDALVEHLTSWFNLQRQYKLAEHGILNVPLRRAFEDQKRKDLAAKKKAIEGFGFDLQATILQCTRDNKEETGSAGQSMLGRILKEVTSSVEKKDGKCQEKENHICPEGTSAASRRGFDKAKFGKVFYSICMLSKPFITFPMGFVLGTVFGGPAAGVALGAKLTALPGVGEALPLPFAAFAAVDIFPQCRCYPNDCVFDVDVNGCTIMSGSSGNPYEHLPYLGQKCILVPDITNKKCALSYCTREDYESPIANSSVTVSGTVGKVTDRGMNNGVYNCLMLNGQEVLWNEAMDGNRTFDNTPLGRTKLYDVMKVPRKNTNAAIVPTSKEYNMNNNYLNDILALPQR